MKIAASAIWRDHPSHCSNRLSSAVFPEKQEHGATAHIEGKTLVGVHAGKTEKRFIERFVEVDVKADLVVLKRNAAWIERKGRRPTQP
jgi:hypothetical protein